MHVDTLIIRPAENRYVVREALRRAPAQRALIVLPWDVERGWELPLDYEVLLNTALAEKLEIAWAVEDPERRAVPREVGFPVFASEAKAQAYLEKHGAFPPLKPPSRPKPRRRPPWAEEPRPNPLPLPHPRPWWHVPLSLALLGIAFVAIGVTAFLALPSAQVRLVPQGASYQVVVPISVDPSLDSVDLQRNLIPARRIGDEFESYAEVATSGLGFSFSGRSTGSVLFTNLLGQEYRVPKGTVVRTSAGSFPVRFATTEETNVPSFGQAAAPVEALEEGPRGNVGPYQINFVEGVVGFALKVTNPDVITGAASQEVATVLETDKDRAWELAAEHVLAEAYNGLQTGDYLQAGEFMPRQSLAIQAAPKAAYTNLVGEHSPVLGVTLRLLVTGQSVKATDAQAVAYRELVRQLPEGYTLTDARFEYGESAEEDIGPGLFTFYVTAHGYATAKIDTTEAHRLILGRRVEAAQTQLMEAFPLTQPPEVEVSPHWFPFLPRLPIRTEVTIMPGKWE